MSSAAGAVLDQHDQPVDFIIVGAGAAGCVLAARLSEDPDCRVLLLEAGGEDEHPAMPAPSAAFQLFGTDAAWQDATVPQPALGGRPLGYVTGRGLGGGSSINTMAWFHGRPEDYDGWQQSGAAGWGWRDVLPHLRRSEHHANGPSEHHGAGGPMVISSPRDINPLSMAFIAAGAEQGIPVTDDFNGPAGEGIGLAPVNIRDGARHSVVAGYLRPALARPNLTVRTHCPVEKVLMAGDRAVGVLTGGPGAGEIHARRSVVLCAGAIRTPQLLLLSGIGGQSQLAEHGIPVVRDLPGVGADLQDHPLVFPVWPVTHGRTMLEEAVDPDVQRAYQLLRRGTLASINQAVAMLRSDPDLPGPDIQLYLTLFGVAEGGAALPDPAVTCPVALLTPASRGTVGLRSADPQDPPLIDPRYLSVAQDRTRLAWGVRRAVELFQAPALQAVTGPPLLDLHDDTALDAFIDQSVGSLFHPVGTCRMGTDAGSVVGPDLAVHGVHGLRVVDASVMPTITRGNTHAPTIMIAERAATLIASAS